MAQIINDPGRSAGFGQLLGGGLGHALQSLAETKVQDLQRRSMAQGLENILGLSPEDAYQASFLDPSILREITKNKLQEPYNQAYAQGINQILGLGGAEGAQIGVQQPSIAEKLSSLESQAPQEVPISPAEQLGIKESLPQQQIQAQQKARIPALKPEQASKLAELHLQKERLAQKEREMSAKERRELDKESKVYVDQLYKEGEAARKGDMRLDRMEELVKSGKLANASVSSFVDTLGRGLGVLGLSFDATSLLSPESQEFKKLSADFLKEAKDIFGARLTDTDVKFFLQTVPSLSQSNEGKLRLINNIRSFNEGARIKKDIAQRIIKENGGKRPIDLESRVEEEAAPLLDAISKKFKAGFEGKAPKEQHILPGIAKPLASLVGFSPY